MISPSRWSRHTEATEPGRFRPQIARLPGDVTTLGRSVQTLLVHSDCLALYGLDAGLMADAGRATLPVETRLDGLAAAGRLDLAEGRPPAGRAVGTCRDFALLLCSFLRTHGVPARVRCGFASYFGEGWWDHWICEYWSARAAAWLRADAELDETMRRACGIAFDPFDMPPDAFLTAGEAWLACGAGRLEPDAFGHGEHRGWWFMGVDVVRDGMSLGGQEMSCWDTWRQAPVASRHVSADERLRLDVLARHPETPPRGMIPPWLASPSAVQSSK